MYLYYIYIFIFKGIIGFLIFKVLRAFSIIFQSYPALVKGLCLFLSCPEGFDVMQNIT